MRRIGSGMRLVMVFGVLLCLSIGVNAAQSTRTKDNAINSRGLYQLSYEAPSNDAPKYR